MTWGNPDTRTYICARCYRERPMSDTPTKSQGEHTNQTYLICGDCTKKMTPKVASLPPTDLEPE